MRHELEEDEYSGNQVTIFEVVHSVLDIVLASGVLYALRPAKKRRKHVAASAPVIPAEGHDVEIWKGEHFIGHRPAGHPDIEHALNTNGLHVRWPDGTIQERP